MGYRTQAGEGRRRSRERDVPEDAVEEPSWAIPATVIVAVGILSLGFLAYYFAPTVSEILGHAPKPSEASQPVDVTIGGARYLIPANFTRYAYGRRGGIQDKIELFALLPDLSPYQPDEAGAFGDNSADSRVAYFDLEARRDGLAEPDRYHKIYLRLVTDPQGDRGPYGLRRFQFDPTTAYHDEELFVEEHDDGTVVLLRCFKEMARVVSPTCRRDLEIGDGITLHYRFMRSRLGDWREIDAKIRALVQSFAVAAKPQ